MPHISELLSQHGLLTSICGGLSSADLANLAATSREHRTYIASSKPIYTKLMSSTICSGKGLEVQEKIFGPRRALYRPEDDEFEEYYDKNPEEKRCLGPDSRPCSQCGAHVCDSCRFHFIYAFEGIAGFDADDHAVHVEYDHAVDVEDDGIRRGERSIQKIECRKAFNIFWEKRHEYFCASCEPLLLPDTNDKDICKCDFYDHFVGNRWLCIPCFFEEEAAAQKTSNEKVVGYDAGTRTFITHPACDCGRLAEPMAVTACRICARASCWDPNREQLIQQKILSQLGHQPGREGILAQLG